MFLEELVVTTKQRSGTRRMLLSSFPLLLLLIFQLYLLPRMFLRSLVHHIVDLHHVNKPVTAYMLYKVRTQTQHFIAHTLNCSYEAQPNDI